LLAAGILTEADVGLTAGNATIRERTLASAPWSQRKQSHLKLANACLKPPVRLEAAAYHFEQGGQNDEASRAFLAAADAHCRRHHHAAAKRCFLAGLELLPAETPDTAVVAALQNLGRCAGLAADVSDATREVRTWLSTAPWCDRIAVRAEGNLQLAALFEHDGRHVESARARRAAARDLAALGRDEEAAGASIAAAAVLAYAAQINLAREAAEAAVHAAARVTNIALQAQAAIWRGLILGMLGDTAAGQADLTRALELALAHKLTGEAAEAQRLLGTVQEYASHYPDEQTAFARALDYCHRNGATFTAGICLGCLSYSLLRSGDWKRSDETARRVVSDRTIPAPSRYVAQSVLGLLHAHRGETRPALDLLRRSLNHCRSIGLLVMDFFNLPGLAMVAETMGDVEEASARYSELLEFWRSTDDRHDAIPGLSLAATFFADQRRTDDAAATAEALDRIASLTANPEAAGAALAASGELFLLNQEPARAAARFRQALAQYDRRQLSVEPILVRVRLGLALQQTGATGEAHSLLTDARQQARRLGARPLVARAEAVMARPEMTASPKRDRDQPAVATWELLSARQREVARNLARGLTNKEIALQLGVSVRTVDMHVAHIFARLNCRTRAEAAGLVTAALS
jgi:DNA-binding NarL/FixJ family response regulator